MPIGARSGLVDADEAAILAKEAEEIAVMINGLIKYFEGRR